MNLVRWVVGNPVFSVALTVLAYAAALPLHHRWRWIPPIVAACLPIVAVLLLAREPYVDYNRGGSFLTWWLGPATVALAAPMYRHGMALRSSLPKLVLIVLAGSVVGMATAGLTAWLLGAPLPAGVLGASFGPPFLRLVGVKDDRAVGAAIGCAAHGIGTASLVRQSEMQATVSSWAMAASGVFTSLLAVLVALFLR